jgi:transposase
MVQVVGLVHVSANLGRPVAGVADSGVDEKEAQVIVHAAFNKAWAMCPKCGTRSDSVHSYRRRRVAGLPVLGRTVILDVDIRRWRCCSDDCSSREFNEVIPGFIEMRRRRNVRLQTVLTAVGMELG